MMDQLDSACCLQQVRARKLHGGLVRIIKRGSGVYKGQTSDSDGLLTLHNTTSLILQLGRVAAEKVVGAEEEGEFSYITITLLLVRYPTPKLYTPTCHHSQSLLRHIAKVNMFCRFLDTASPFCVLTMHNIELLFV
jgi:hypothetical protein